MDEKRTVILFNRTCSILILLQIEHTPDHYVGHCVICPLTRGMFR